MRLLMKSVLVGLALGAATTAASAAVNFTSPAPFDGAPAVTETALYNFDTPGSSLLSYTGNVFQGFSPGWYAAPANDATRFGAAEANDSSVLSVTPGHEFNSLSFYLGSLDSYNSISFFNGNTLVKSYTGTDLTIPNPADGNQDGGDTNRRYFFTFGAADGVNRVVFGTTAPAFEFDNIAAAVSAVPEPATWAMMIFGFGFMGFMLRGRRRENGAVATA
jgi:hypothetical protein